jgi:hypothetical protein
MTFDHAEAVDDIWQDMARSGYLEDDDMTGPRVKPLVGDPQPPLTGPTDSSTNEVLACLENARTALAGWNRAWGEVLRAMREADMSTTRLEAYRVGTGYDEGGGQSIEAWMQEIEDAAMGVPEGMCPCGMYPRGEHGCQGDPGAAR